jgi:hypothetical protein
MRLTTRAIRLQREQQTVLNGLRGIVRNELQRHMVPLIDTTLVQRLLGFRVRQRQIGLLLGTNASGVKPVLGGTKRNTGTVVRRVSWAMRSIDWMLRLVAIGF